MFNCYYLQKIFPTERIDKRTVHVVTMNTTPDFSNLIDEENIDILENGFHIILSPPKYSQEDNDTR
jgi:hypothetical protein